MSDGSGQLLSEVCVGSPRVRGVEPPHVLLQSLWRPASLTMTLEVVCLDLVPRLFKQLRCFSLNGSDALPWLPSRPGVGRDHLVLLPFVSVP